MDGTELYRSHPTDNDLIVLNYIKNIANILLLKWRVYINIWQRILSI